MPATLLVLLLCAGAAAAGKVFGCQHGSQRTPGVKRTNFNIHCEILPTPYLHKPAEREVWRHVHWVRNTRLRCLPSVHWRGSSSSRDRRVVALTKEVYELYPHVVMTLGVPWQLFAHKIPQEATKRVPTAIVCRGQRGVVVVGPCSSGLGAPVSLEAKVQRRAW